MRQVNYCMAMNYVDKSVVMQCKKSMATQYSIDPIIKNTIMMFLPRKNALDILNQDKSNAIRKDLRIDRYRIIWSIDVVVLLNQRLYAVVTSHSQCIVCNA